MARVAPRARREIQEKVEQVKGKKEKGKSKKVKK
jgi:hypothetical protein